MDYNDRYNIITNGLNIFSKGELSEPTTTDWRTDKNSCSIIYAKPISHPLDTIIGQKNYIKRKVDMHNNTKKDLYESVEKRVGMGGREDEWWVESQSNRERDMSFAASASMIKNYETI